MFELLIVVALFIVGLWIAERLREFSPARFLARVWLAREEMRPPPPPPPEPSPVERWPTAAWTSSSNYSASSNSYLTINERREVQRRWDEMVGGRSPSSVDDIDLRTPGSPEDLP